jgi:hypothetical protein
LHNIRQLHAGGFYLGSCPGAVLCRRLLKHFGEVAKTLLRVLSEETAVRVDGRWRMLRAVLVTAMGGRRVVYFDSNGVEVHSEPLCKSKFKNLKIEQEGTNNGTD